MSQSVTVTKHSWPLQVVFLGVTSLDITFYVVNNHLIARTIILNFNSISSQIYKIEF